MDAQENWARLETDITGWLQDTFSTRFQFRGPGESIVGFPSDGFRSDGMITDGKVLLAVEIEAKQTHPDTNSGKYLFLYRKYRAYEKIVLFHVYTPLFDSYPWRKALAEFYVTELGNGVPIEYIVKDFRKNTDYRRALNELKRSIQEKVILVFS